MFKSLTKRILIVIILLIFICSVSLTGVSYYEIQRSVTSQMKSDGTTLVLNIKRQIIENNVSDLKELQDIFIKIKQESNENITYVSFSDQSSNVIVSDSELKAESDSKVDSVSSATSTGDVSKVVSEQKTMGHILTTSTGEKVYNISTDFSFQSEAGALNIGISLKSMYDQIWNALIQTIGITLLVMILAMIIGLVMARRIIKPITMMSNGIKIFADGDFTNGFEYKSRDEIGEMCTALDHMRQTLRTMVGNIQQNANQVSQSSLNLATAIEETSCTAEGISKASGELANGSTDLANRSQEGLERLNNLANEINALFDRADSMTKNIEQTRGVNQTGTNCIKELQQAIDANANVTLKIKEQVDVLGLKSNAISQVTTVIKSIAEQTNLLALNAMIESARAGEQGKGFAVVAEEIGKLSEQTSKSIEGIESIVQEVGYAVSKTQDYMEEGYQLTSRTTTVSHETGKAFEMIDHTVADILKEIQVLIDSVTQVNGDKNEVIGAIESISTIAQQSTASTEEIASSLEHQLMGIDNIGKSAQELRQIAVELEKLVGHFKL